VGEFAFSKPFAYIQLNERGELVTSAGEVVSNINNISTSSIQPQSYGRSYYYKAGGFVLQRGVFSCFFLPDGSLQLYKINMQRGIKQLLWEQPARLKGYTSKYVFVAFGALNVSKTTPVAANNIGDDSVTICLYDDLPQDLQYLKDVYVLLPSAPLTYVQPSAMASADQKNEWQQFNKTHLRLRAASSLTQLKGYPNALGINEVG